MIGDTCTVLVFDWGVASDVRFRCRVPAADVKASQDVMDETFLLSNIAPQVGDGFNRHCECVSSTRWGVVVLMPYEVHRRLVQASYEHVL